VNASTAERMAIARPAGLTLSSSASSPALVLPAANPFIAFSLTPKTDTGIAAPLNHSLGLHREVQQLPQRLLMPVLLGT
jgi:hypothetical protein